MLNLYEQRIKPLQSELRKSLGIESITVRYIPTEMRANYHSTNYNLDTHVTKHIYQFDPMGYNAFKESRE